MRAIRLGTAMLLGLVAVLLLATTASAASSFPDVPTDNPNRVAIEGLADRSIVGGYANGDFGPSDLVKRMQFAKMIVLTMGYSVTAADQSTFADTPAASALDPLYPGSYVAAANARGVIQGYTVDNTFRFYNNITRYQMVTLVVRAAGSKLSEPPAGWSGVLSASDPTHGPNVRKAEYNNLLDGLVGLSPSYNFQENATRGECAQVLWNLLGFMQTESPWTALLAAGTASPSARAGQAAAFDPVSGKMIMFGGYQAYVSSSATLLGDTWAYNPTSNTWANLNPASAPPAFELPCMIYDPAGKKMILFGGAQNAPGQTWAYDPVANTWTNQNPSGSVPHGRFGESMVYDPVGKKVILFGGVYNDAGAHLLNDLWIYDPGKNAWTQLNPAGPLPSGRFRQSMVYCAATGKLVMFGGLDGQNYLHDTWAYDPNTNTWSDLNPSGDIPAGRMASCMDYDPTSKKTLLFGGATRSVYGSQTVLTTLNDSAAYDPVANEWTSLGPFRSPGARSGASMFWDPTGKRFILFGGDNINYYQVLADLWSYTP